MKKILIENSKISTLNTKQKELNENINSDSLVFYSVPIWRLDEKNLNNRIYPYSLGEKIVEQNLVTYCYNNHPEDEISQDYNSVKAIAKNPQINENNLCVDIHLVDKSFGLKLKEIVNAGSEIGVSSVGYGTLNENNEIITEDYELVRYLDFVLNPSYSVYISNENNSKRETEEEIGEETSNPIEETTVSIFEEELEEINKRFNKWKN